MKCPKFQTDNPEGWTPCINRVSRIAVMLRVCSLVLAYLLVGAMVGCCCTPGTPSDGLEAPVEGEWSFAIITDIHTGRGYLNYEGQDYYLTKRLEEMVNWINDDTTSDIRFVVVLGDISDHGEYSELNRARGVLDSLDEEIPYIPMIGNHDVWPSIDINGNEISQRETENLEFFGIVFREKLDNLQTQFDTWTEGPGSSVGHELYNYAFTYDDVRFIFLDYVKRAPSGDPYLFDETNNFLIENLPDNGEKVVIFSHYPIRSSIWSFIPWTSEGWFTCVKFTDAPDILENYKNVAWHFAGHYHGFDKEFLGLDTPVYRDANIQLESDFLVEPIPVVLTEATMVGSNTEQPKSIIRIVTMTADGNLNYGFLPIEQFMTAANPRFNYHDEVSFTFASVPSLQIGIDVELEFSGKCYSKLPISNWEWSFGSLLPSREEEIVYVTSEEILLLDQSGSAELPVELTVTYNPDMQESIGYDVDISPYVDQLSGGADDESDGL